MAFTPVERMQIKNAVERVLHVPGNYNGGTLEMAMVFDCNLSKEPICQIGKGIATLLKSHSEVFRNVRLNGIQWESDTIFIKEVTSLPHLQMGRYFEEYKCIEHRKRLELLTEQLKKFYARSKVILLFTDGNYQIEDLALFKESIHPFLYRKLIIVECCSDTVNTEDMDIEGQAEGASWKLQVHAGTELLRLES